MTVTVLLFAHTRELLGRDAVTLTLPPAATVADLRSHLAAAYPVLAAVLPRSAVAVNQEFVADAHALGPGDEIAVIPPVSGG